MIINNTHVQGIFLYDPSIEYELGDFVVYGDCIYIVITGTVFGETPGTGGSYKIYPGEMIESAEDYYKYLEGDSVDKFVSAHALFNILQSAYFGVGDTGEIKSYVSTMPTGEINYSVAGVEETLKVSDDVLSKILTSAELNNGCLMINPSVPGIPEVFQRTPAGTVILRQYTYTELGDNGKKRRVQELIDPLEGEVYYRYSTGPGWLDNVSKWRVNRISDKNLSEKIQAIKDFYTSRLNIFRNNLSSLRGSFRFRSATPAGLGSDVVTITPENLKGRSDFSSGCIVNLVVEKESEPGIKHSWGLSINLGEPGGTCYCVGSSGLMVEIGKIPDVNVVTLKVKLIATPLVPSGAKIVDIYYRELYA